MRAQIRVWNKPGVTDSISAHAQSFFPGAAGVTVGKYFQVRIDDTAYANRHLILDTICTTILINPMIETYAFRVESRLPDYLL